MIYIYIWNSNIDETRTKTQVAPSHPTSWAKCCRHDQHRSSQRLLHVYDIVWVETKVYEQFYEHDWIWHDKGCKECSVSHRSLTNCGTTVCTDLLMISYDGFCMLLHAFATVEGRQASRPRRGHWAMWASQGRWLEGPWPLTAWPLWRLGRSCALHWGLGAAN